MEPFELHPAFYNQPIRLSSEEQATPLEILQALFDNCPLSTLRKTLWELVEASLALPHSVYDDADERRTLLWQYRQLERALEAASLLCVQAETNPNKF